MSEKMSRRNFVAGAAVGAVAVIAAVAGGGQVLKALGSASESSPKSYELQDLAVSFNPNREVPLYRNSAANIIGINGTESTLIGAFHAQEPEAPELVAGINISDITQHNADVRAYRDGIAANGIVVPFSYLEIIDTGDNGMARVSNLLGEKPDSDDSGSGIWLKFNPAEIPDDLRRHFPNEIFTGEYDFVYVNSGMDNALPVANADDDATRILIEDLYKDRPHWTPPASE